MNSLYKQQKFLPLALVMITASILLSSFYLLPVQAASTKTGTSLSITKTAQTHFIRSTDWSINKSVSPQSIDLFKGDSVTPQYQIDVTKTVSDIYQVNGQICVKNGGSVATQNLVIFDHVQSKKGSGQYTDIAGATQTITPAQQIQPGQTVCYPYLIEFTPIPNVSYRNAVDVTITNHSGNIDTPFGPSFRTDVTFPKSPELQGYSSIDVSDDNGQSFSFGASGSQTYTQEYNCDSDDGTHSNTATIDQTGQSASASIDVNCYALEVTKDASTSNARTWGWTIDKSAQVTFDGLNIHYTVTLTGTPTLGYQATGNIKVHNPAPIAAIITSLPTDAVTGPISGTVDCGAATFPYTIPSGGDLNCTYGVNLPNTNSRTNTATATLQNHSIDSSGTPTDSGTTDFSGTAAINFGVTPTTTDLDECATVQDVNSFGLTYNVPQYCATGTTTNTVFTEYDLGITGNCGGVSISNTATFTTNDSGATASDGVSVSNAGGSGFGLCQPIREPSPPPEVPWREVEVPPE
ncbi:MAG TPA: hypothetical protein VLD38_03385 [Nitrosopumilaceae archaeon]|nr:hypothetical protein [Nitrosopumilaceae archaeon]